MLLSRLTATSNFAARAAAFQRFGGSTTASYALRGFAASVGDKLPPVELHLGFPPKKYNLYDFCKDRSVIIIPNYLEHQDALRKLGISNVIVYCVNDAAVMQAWAKDQKTGKSMLQLMADPGAELTHALDLEMTHPGPISKGIIGRCKRHAIYAHNGEIKAIQIAESEDDPAGDDHPEPTLAEAMIAIIENIKSKES